MFRKTYAKAFGLTVLLAVVWTCGAAAQDTAPAGGGTTPSLSTMWADLIHYIKIARTDAALANAQGIVQSNADPIEVYRLSVQTPDYLSVFTRGQALPGLAEPLGQIRALVEQGYQQEARDPQRIAQAVEMLSGSLRQYQIGAERLTGSGEYAVPQLVQRLSDPATSQVLRDRIANVLPMIGREAVRPLVAALQTQDPALKQAIARALGQIGYPSAAPYLRAIVADPQAEQTVRETAAAALVNIGGQEALARPVANMFYELAEGYYNNAESLQADVRYEAANVWFWQEGLGLTFIEVPRAIFMDVYAMREARHTLDTDPQFYPAVSLWLAANLRKESQLTAGTQDPTRPADQVSADAYARAAGAQYMQQVLARGLRDRDAAVAMGAISALTVVAGEQNLLRPAEGGVTPLVEALSFSNRRVRFMAAEALAGARPSTGFTGDQFVVQVLVEALRQSGQPVAIVIDPDQDRGNAVRDLLRAGGFQILDAPSLSDAIGMAQQSSGVDLAILGANVQMPGLAQTVAALRAEPTLAPVPVVVLAAPGEARVANEIAAASRGVAVLTGEELTAAALELAIAQATAAGAGGQSLTPEEAAAWALRAAQTLEMLANTNNPVFDLSRAEPALIDSLRSPRTEQQVAAAWALAALRSGTAQQALVTLANDEQVSQEVRVPGYLAAAKSVRLFGSQMTDAQVSRLLEVVRNGQTAQEIRSAASALMGAASLPSEQIESLITSTREHP